MQAALHQHAGASKLDGLSNLVVNRLEIENIAFFRLRPFQRAIKRAKRAIFCTEICVVDIAINDVGDHALGMQLAANRVGFNADPNEVVGAVEVEGLGVGEGHEHTILLQAMSFRMPSAMRNLLCRKLW